MNWASVAGYEGRYEVSIDGRVRSLRKGKHERILLLRASVGSNGYLTVGLHKDGRQKTAQVHQLVAHAFLGPCPAGMQVNHIDANKQNAAASNLEYCTASKNRAHSFAIGRESTAGERSKVAKLNSQQVQEIRLRVASGEMQKQVARAFGVVPSNVSQICAGTRWACIKRGG